jgi:phage terminase small subunit
MSIKKPRKPSRPGRSDFERFRKFAEHYLDLGSSTFLNALRSAEAAGYSPAYARADGRKILDNPGVQAEMRRLRDERCKRSTIAGPVEVLEALTSQMRMLPNKLMEKGELIPLDKMTTEQAHAIAGAKTVTKTIQAGDDTITEVRLEYKLVDRTRAAVELAKHFGLFEKDNRQQKPDAQPLVLMTAKPLTLQEWSEQADALQAQMKARQQEANVAPNLQARTSATAEPAVLRKGLRQVLI